MFYLRMIVCAFLYIIWGLFGEYKSVKIRIIDINIRYKKKSIIEKHYN